jgi:hypothetical protein
MMRMKTSLDGLRDGNETAVKKKAAAFGRSPYELWPPQTLVLEQPAGLFEQTAAAAADLKAEAE